MPYVHITTTVPVDDQQKSDLLEEIATLLPILPGKNRDNAMVQIDGARFMAMGNPKSPCAFVEIRLYRASPDAAKEKFASEITDLLGKALGVPASHVYLNYMELDHWGMNGGII